MAQMKSQKYGYVLSGNDIYYLCTLLTIPFEIQKPIGGMQF